MSNLFENANAAAVASGGNFIYPIWQSITSTGDGPEPGDTTGIPCYDSDGSFYPYCRITVNVEPHSNYFTSYFIVTVADAATTYTITIDEDGAGDEVYSATTSTYTGDEATNDAEKILYGLKQVYEDSAFSGCIFEIVTFEGSETKYLKVVAPSACVKVAKSSSGGSGIWYGYGDCSTANVVFLAKQRENKYESFWGQFSSNVTYNDNITMPITDIRGVEKIWAIVTSMTIKTIYSGGITPMVRVHYSFFSTA